MIAFPNQSFSFCIFSDDFLSVLEQFPNTFCHSSEGSSGSLHQCLLANRVHRFQEPSKGGHNVHHVKYCVTKVSLMFWHGHPWFHPSCTCLSVAWLKLIWLDFLSSYSKFQIGGRWKRRWICSGWMVWKTIWQIRGRMEIWCIKWQGICTKGLLI